MPYLSSLANSILYSPFDDAATPGFSHPEKCFSAKKFIENCFVEPLFEMNKKCDENVKEDTDYFITMEEYREKRYEGKRNYENFINWINQSIHDKIYTISGNAGTGKTTFINWLKYSRKEEIWIILDVSTATEGFYVTQNDCIEIPNFEMAIMKIYSVMIKKIVELLLPRSLQQTEAGLLQMIENLNGILNHYHKLQENNILFELEILEEIEKIIRANKGIRTKILNISAYLIQFFKKLFSSKQIVTSFENLSKIFDLFTYLIRFVFGLDKRIVLVFDNIERFIKSDEIFNPEVENFRKQLNGYCSNINEEGKLNYGIFKIILALRSCTNRRHETRQQTADSLPYNLDLSEWFDADKIINKRKEYFIKLQSSEEDIKTVNLEDVKWIEKITGDFQVCRNRHITGLKIFIDDLFNNDKRLIFDFLGCIIEKNGKLFCKFKELWGGHSTIERFAARSIMKSLILIELKEQGFFENLKVNPQHDELGLGTTRKILSILLNSKNNEGRYAITLSEILSKLYGIEDLQNHFKDLIDQRKIDLADILIYLDICNRRENNWLQFIDIQYAGSNEDTRLINDRSFYLQLFNKNVRGLNDLKVSIMPAGEVFLKNIVSSFEYFSIRYCQPYYPLFSLVPTEEELDRIPVRNLECVKIMRRVQRQAQKCIDRIQNSETDDFKVTFGKRDYFHHQRIIQNHREYLDSFAEYIQSFNKDKYKELMNVIYEIRDQYPQN